MPDIPEGIPFDIDEFVGAASDDLGLKHAAARGDRHVVREVFGRALGRAVRDQRGQDFRELKAKAAVVLVEDGGLPRIVVPPVRRTR